MTGAKEYAKALFLLTEEENTTESALGELSALADIMSDSPEYSRLLDTPALPKEERLSLIDEALSSFDERLLSLIKILAEARLTRIVPELCREYYALYREARGILDAEAITAIPMSASQLEAMKQKLEAETGKKVILKNTVDKSTLGGVMLRYEGVQLDGSVKTRLDKFEEALTETVI